MARNASEGNSLSVSLSPSPPILIAFWKRLFRALTVTGGQWSTLNSVVPGYDTRTKVRVHHFTIFFPFSLAQRLVMLHPESCYRCIRNSYQYPADHASLFAETRNRKTISRHVPFEIKEVERILRAKGSPNS